MRISILGPGDEGLLQAATPGVFDNPTRPSSVNDFLQDPRHHMAVAIDDDRMVGFASGVHYVHPDKAPELWINEVGVALTHRRRGLAKALVEALLDLGRELGCREAWVLTEAANAPARGLYEAAGGVEAGQDIVMYEFSIDGADSLGADRE